MPFSSSVWRRFLSFAPSDSESEPFLEALAAGRRLEQIVRERAGCKRCSEIDRDELRPCHTCFSAIEEAQRRYDEAMKRLRAE
jgi:hypothetical protein